MADFNPLHVGDVAAFLRSASDRFGELAALFDVLSQRLHVDEQDDLRKLARLGKDVAFDYENTFDSFREQVEKGGVRS